MSTAAATLKERLQQELDDALAEIARLEERLGRKGEYGLGKGDPSIYEWEMCLALKQRAEGKAKSLRGSHPQGRRGRLWHLRSLRPDHRPGAAGHLARHPEVHHLRSKALSAASTSTSPGVWPQATFLFCARPATSPHSLPSRLPTGGFSTKIEAL